MEKHEIIKSIASRTGGDIYLGIVGAVRTGKSTFIKKFMENLVIPNIEDEYEKRRALDELPQSAGGKNIMTTEPKFVPSTAAKIQIDDFTTNIRLVDCVGYVIPAAKGYEDENGPRMVRTPWYDEAIPFVEAAEIGTEKVIKDHSTIGIVVTTDGSIGDIGRKEYIEAENIVINELKAIGKPFIVLVNSSHPMTPDTQKLTESISLEHNVPALAINMENMSERDIYNILKEALYEFPVLEVKVEMPEWVAVLNSSHWLKCEFIEKIRESVVEIDKIKDVEHITEHFKNSEYITKCYLSELDATNGTITLKLHAKEELYNQILNEIIGFDISSKGKLLEIFQDFNEAKIEYDQIKSALKMVKQTGYGVASPSLADMKLDTPEIVKQGSRYGIKLKAVAPSIHITTIKMMLLNMIDGLMLKAGNHLSLNMK